MRFFKRYNFRGDPVIHYGLDEFIERQIYTEGERKYFNSRGEDAIELLEENGLAVNRHGQLALVLSDGHILEEGDLVRLKSGGPPMTAAIISRSCLDDVSLKVDWFEGGEFKSAWMNPRLLVYVRPRRRWWQFWR